MHKILQALAALTVSSTLITIAGPAAALESGSERVTVVENAMKRASIEGAVVVMIEGGAVTWQKAFGMRGKGQSGSRGPMTLDTQFEAASNGKMLTAFMLMQLIEEGRYSLDTPLEDPRLVIAKGCEAPTLSHALSHTAGLGNNLGAQTFTPACKPGQSFSYAGEGYMILQSMVDQLASGTIEDVMAKRVFSELQMGSASFVPRETDTFAIGHIDLAFGLLSKRASSGDQRKALLIGLFFLVCLLTSWVLAFRRHRLIIAIPTALIVLPLWLGLYVLSLSQIVVPIARHLGEPNLASSLQITAPDLAKFAEELINPRVISPKARDLMMREEVVINEVTSWANGIGIDRSDGHTTYWHWGSNPGFQSLFVVEPETGNGIVILTNTGGFLDFASKKRGGYNMSKAVARDLLAIDGAWDVRGYR